MLLGVDDDVAHAEDRGNLHRPADRAQYDLILRRLSRGGGEGRVRLIERDAQTISLGA